MARPGTDRAVVATAGAPTSSQIVKADGKFAKVVNMRMTDDDTLETVREPVDLTSGAAYTATRGVHYAVLEGGSRKVLLMHDDDEIKVFKWNSGTWTTLAGPSGPLYLDLPSDEDSRMAWPTQFVTTPNGVVIVPANGRALFYDGEVCGPLGFEAAPEPPLAFGPKSSEMDTTISDHDNRGYIPFGSYGVNDLNYNATSLPGLVGSAHEVFEGCRVGTIFKPNGVAPSIDTDIVKGYLLAGLYRAVRQDIDMWGNLSPASEPSADINIDFQSAQAVPLNDAQRTALGVLPAGGIEPPVVPRWVRPDLARKQVAWGVSPGRDGVVARIIARTKDVTNTGDVEFYELPLNAQGVQGALGTLPDNVTRIYPDNIPDSWLTTKLTDVAPVPRFKLAALAFGRLWIANFEDDIGAMLYSEVGLWGTFLKNSKRYPDPRGGEITGLHTVDRGLLVFTKSSTFLYTASDDGQDVKRTTLSTSIGCTAPGSLASLRNGMTIWLAEDGFYGFDGSTISFLFGEHKEQNRRHNPTAVGRSVAAFDPTYGEYVCWVPVDGGRRPNRGYMYDGVAWRWRDDIVATGVCRAGRDVVVSGKTTSEGVFVMHKGSTTYSTSTIDTGWIMGQGDGRKTLQRVILQLRETFKPASGTRLQVKVYRDYDPSPVSTDTLDLSPTHDDTSFDPTFWGGALSSESVSLTGVTANIRRPFYAKADVYADGSSVFRVVIECSKPWEFHSMLIEFADKGTPGAQLSRRRTS